MIQLEFNVPNKKLEKNKKLGIIFMLLHLKTRYKRARKTAFTLSLLAPNIFSF